MYLLGDAPPIEADECFSETWDHLSQMLTQQAVVYEEEEHALRVLMEAGGDGGHGELQEWYMEAWRGGREVCVLLP